MEHRRRLAPRHISCALLLLAACAAAGSGAPPGGSVLSIKGAEEFSQALADYPLLVVAFVAPWCGHCKRLEPVLREVAAGYASDKAPVAFAQLDATDKANNEELRVRYNVHGFPTLKVRELILSAQLDRIHAGIGALGSVIASPPHAPCRSSGAGRRRLSTTGAPETPRA